MVVVPFLKLGLGLGDPVLDDDDDSATRPRLESQCFRMDGAEGDGGAGDGAGDGGVGGALEMEGEEGASRSAGLP